ncbi:MAG: ATP-binding cassette domain-containing protein [Bdellovibrio sp.]|nr:ATP-binding cassette domain-containing protein [Bdellovibrio sp.]
MDSKTDKLLTLENIAVGHSERLLFSNVSIEFKIGEWVAIVGPNGSGKSTFLKTLAGTLNPRTGRRTAHFTSAGYVPQRFIVSAASSLTVKEFLELKPSTLDYKSGTISNELIQEMGIGDFLDRPLRILSGGQTQRVLLTFACLGNPRILFLDEALEGIDLTAKGQIIAFLQRERESRKLTIIEVTHDLAGVTTHAERVILVSEGVLFDGSPHDENFHDCIHSIYGKKIRLECAPEFLR